MSGKVVCSSGMQSYFSELNRKNDICYSIARRARGKGLDPQPRIEIPQAEDLASRVEKLLADYGVEGVSDDIRRLTEEYKNREVVSLMIAKEIAKRPAESREKAIDRAIRVGLAVLTEGILVAPLEGLAGTKIMTNSDGSEYIDLIFAGPIRAAGGTGQAMSVLIADMVRHEHNIGRYVPTESEVKRFHEEIPLYKQCQHLQYLPSNKEIELIVGNCPVCIDGEGTEDSEISGFRDLPRVETNRVRGGACLVIAEGLCQKAAKIKKHVDTLKIDGWDFIGELLSMKKSDKDEEADSKVIKPSDKYLKDIVAGRPIFGHPSRVGGFRLRYGRGRTCGLAAIALNPASMYALDGFPALGTQIKIERPGKAGAVTPCDSIDGPILLLKNGDLVQCGTKEEVQAIHNNISEIIDNGEILIPFGEFSENNHKLVPCGYTVEWHKQELMAKGGIPEDWASPTYDRAKQMSSELGIPLHPSFNLFWYDVELERLKGLREFILKNGHIDENNALILPKDAKEKRVLEDLGALHTVAAGKMRVERYAMPLIECLGLCASSDKIIEKAAFDGTGPLDAVSKAMGIEVRARAVTRIGSRMARPEKAKERKMNPPVHSLFPVGRDPGSKREMNSAIAVSRSVTSSIGSSSSRPKGVQIDVGIRRCTSCGNVSVMASCDRCGSYAKFEKIERSVDGNGSYVDIASIYERALKRLGADPLPELKCVEGLSSKVKVPEALEKGILRAMNDVHMFKDGTIRYDMTDVPITHFRPREIELSVEKAKELGYTHDMFGDELTNNEQLCELKVQDMVPADSCGDYMVKVAKFVDDMLEKHYGLERFYNAETRKDIIGHLAIGLAPHTSGGILCRIIGYTKACGGYAHPFFHAAKRRNCDGDEDSIILMLDGLINFSRDFLPDRRGGLMDAPLVLTTRLDPNEIDKEAHNVDCLPEYPLEFYRAAMDVRDPKDIEKMMDLVGKRIGTERQYEGLMFTHDTKDISEGPKHSSYTTLETMIQKMEAQLGLGRKIRAVDERDVATRVIDKHFLPDMAGNLRSFSAQNVRCTKCGEKYRRIPLSGRCKCGNNLVLTVHEASVKKYLDVSKDMGEKYGLSEYTRQRIDVLQMSMDSLFNNDKVKKCKLSDFF
ncbi:MAG: DNA polymerase II large subunit [Methanomassiliicoccaceae archaeon]|jgi:DNA polymerase II large subunit|nr:DNA polymerase II large subunit [Methanomassiliicoccaceae archaeon]